MKAKIGEDGILWIERKRCMKIQHCPFDPGHTPCGDWCPLFDDHKTGVLEKGEVRLCKGTVISIAKDQRKS